MPPTPNENNMRAWMVFCGDPLDSCLLVYAATRNQARLVGLRRGPREWDHYTNISARRMPCYDSYAVGYIPYVLETNDNLPEGAEPFYTDE